LSRARLSLRPKKALPWALWIVASVGCALGLARCMTQEGSSKELFLPGKTTHGHYQIELECSACHTTSFPSKDDFQSGCVDCHGEELEESQDSHPVSKFTDPRNADRVEILDARKCVTCHAEHEPERTGSMGLSLPEDYCFHCHQDVAEERPTHEGLAFDSCGNAGCHNFHDNRSLYEDYLIKHGEQPAMIDEGRRRNTSPKNCPSPARAALADGGGSDQCNSCHQAEASSWQGGRHGMRTALGLAPLRVESARLPMKTEAHDRVLGCGSCHADESQGPGYAQVDACLSCHDDTHSKGFAASKHALAFRKELAGKAEPGTGVSCATCHLPTLEDSSGKLWVNHNQNDNLRPNEKMIRSVCQSCHGVAFAIDALADPELVQLNFSRAPAAHVKSVEFAQSRK